MKLHNIQEKLINSGLKLFSRLEFQRLLGVSTVSAQKLLERYTRLGAFVRLKAGWYAFKLKLPSSYLVANKIYRPSYISFESALAYYRMIPEVVYSCTSATTKATRRFEVGEQALVYHKIKREAFTGYKLMQIGEENVLFAEKEKALADYLYYVFLKRMSWNDRLKLKGVDKRKLLSFIGLFGIPKLEGWVKDAIKTTIK